MNRERAAHVAAFLMNAALEVPRGSPAFVPWNNVPRMVADLAAHLVKRFGSVRAAAFWMAVVEQPDHSALLPLMPQAKPWTERHLRNALRRVHGSDVEARVSRIRAKADRNRAALLQLRANPEAFCAALHPEPASPELSCRCGAAAQIVLCNIAVSAELDWTGSATLIGGECERCERERIYGSRRGDDAPIET